MLDASVETPITLRALDVLASADVIAAEDTRSMRRLLDIHGVALGERPLIAYHDHSGAGARDKLMAHLAAGRSVAYASEAGTPLIADPGYDLSRAASEAGHPVTSAPGPSAVATALTLAGAPVCPVVRSFLSISGYMNELLTMPMIAMSAPPPTPPLATLDRIPARSISPPPAAMPSMPSTCPPKPPPRMPTIELPSVPRENFFMSEPAALPPTAPLTN